MNKPNKNKCKQNQMNRYNNPVSIIRARDWCIHICRMITTSGLTLVKQIYKENKKTLLNDQSFIISGFYSIEIVRLNFFLFFCKYVKHVYIAFVLV